MSLKDIILNAQDCPLEPVDVPQWNTTVYVPVLSLADLDDLRKIAASKADDTSAGAAMAVRVIRDENGDRVFSDDDAPALAKKSAKVVNRVIEAFNRHNGIGQQAQDDAAGKSQTTTASDSA